jgi:hypothetical protein
MFQVFSTAPVLSNKERNLFFVTFFVRSKESNQRKGAQQLGLRLSSQNT